MRSADWLARKTIFEDWILSTAGINDTDDLKKRRLRELNSLVDGFHRWQVGYAIAEGAAAGAVGLPGLAVDVPSLITLTLRTVRGVGICYGFTADNEVEREFVFTVISAAGASSIVEKNSAILALRQLQVALFRQTFKAMAAKAAEQTLSKEATIIALRNLARQLGVNQRDFSCPCIIGYGSSPSRCGPSLARDTDGQSRDIPASDAILLRVMWPLTPAGRQCLA